MRLCAFASVGFLGLLLQTLLLHLLTTFAGWPIAPAIAVAVEAAVLHNFLWHERWTWRDRSDRSGALARLARFHLSNGAGSLLGHLVLTTAAVDLAGLAPVPASLAVVAIVGAGNFVASDRWVFSARRLPLVGAMLLVPCAASPLLARGLPAAAAPAWEREVAATETRLAREIDAPPRRHAADGESIAVPGATIHRWRGAILIPDVTVDRVVDALLYPGTPPAQEDVLEARVLERAGTRLRVYLRLERTAIVTATYDTEHDVSFARHSPRVATSRSVATRITETSGGDRGFLWKLNSYWRYLQVDGGVQVELESLSLSRDIPRLVKPLARPVIDRIARESLERTLRALRRHFESARADRPDLDAGAFQRGSELRRETGSIRGVAVDAQAVGFERQARAIPGENHPVADQADRPLAQHLGIVDDRPGQRPRRQRAVGLVGAVGERLACEGEAGLPRRPLESRGGRTEQNQRGVERDHRAGNRRGPGRLPRRHVIEGAVRLDVLQLDPFRGGHAGHGRNLKEHEVFQLVGRYAHLAAAEA